MPIQHIPTQFRPLRPRPYEPQSGLRTQDFFMSLVGYYLQDKMASKRGVKTAELEDTLTRSRMRDDWARQESNREDQQAHDIKLSELKAGQGRRLYMADMRKTHIQLEGPGKLPKGYEPSDEIMGINGETWWVKRKEKSHKVGDIIKTKIGDGKTQVQIVAGYDDDGLPRDTKGEPIATGIFEEEGDQLTRYLKVRTRIYKGLNKGAEPPPEKVKQWMDEKMMMMRSQTNINLGERKDVRSQEKHDIAVGVTVGEKRAALTDNKRNKSIYGSESPQYNNMNDQNEVAFWNTKGIDGTKIIKLSAEALAAGYTPAKIQEKAVAEGRTIESILREAGIIE